jgi:hypothetical protein
MATTRVSKIGYGQKLKSSFGGIITGFLAVVMGIALLWWNEGNSVRDIKKLKEGRGAVIEVDSKKVQSSNDRYLVHVSGMVTTEDTLRDIEFGIAVNALALHKEVEMFQNKENVKREEKENLGGSTTITETFTYEQVWSSELINSDEFQESHRKNPRAFENKPSQILASDGKLGAFELDERVIEQLYGESEVVVYADSTANYRIFDGFVYFGEDPKNPKIGDERIKFTAILPQNFSIIAEQRGNSFAPYKTKVGKNIFMISRGLLSADEMFDQAESASKIFRWALRIGGFFLLFIGFSLVLNPLSTILAVVPFLKSIMGFATGLVAFVLASVISLVVIAIAWLFYRPILAISLLVAAGGIFYFLRKRAQEKKLQQESHTVDTSAAKN